MAVISTHPGGAYYVWRTSAMGSPPPGQFDENGREGILYHAWQRGVPKATARAEYYGPPPAPPPAPSPVAAIEKGISGVGVIQVLAPPPAPPEAPPIPAQAPAPVASPSPVAGLTKGISGVGIIEAIPREIELVPAEPGVPAHVEAIPGHELLAAEQMSMLPDIRAASDQSYPMLASVYDAAGGGGSCGNTSDGHFHYAELGVAGDYGHGRTTGRGNMAISLGMPGELPCGFGVWITYKGKTTYATKSDIGYGDTSMGPNVPQQRRIDLLRNTANYLGFNGLDTVYIKPNWGNASPPPANAKPKPVYANPLERAKVVGERIDQGVDYAGTGQLVAIANGVITEAAPSGWAQFGNYMEYRITEQGQFNGAYIYYAEGVQPTVRKGDKVQAGQVVANIISGWRYGMELGFAAGDGGYHSYYHYHDGAYHEGDATRPGIAFDRLVRQLGGPAGKITGPIVGKWPEYVPNGTIGDVILPAPSASNPAFYGYDPTAANMYAQQYEWGASVKHKWKALSDGGDTGTHHSNSARLFALGKQYVTKAD